MFNRKLKSRIRNIEQELEMERMGQKQDAMQIDKLWRALRANCNHKFDYTISNQIRHVSPGLWTVKCCICGAYETLTAHELTSKQLTQKKEELKALEAKIKETKK